MTPRPILTAAETRAAEEAVIANGTSVEALMERAGAAVAEAAWRFGGGRPTLILCGPGNNGGDGYVAARLLAGRDVAVRVAAAGEPQGEAARAARSGWSGPVETLAKAASAPVLVDALFGTGLARGLAPPLYKALDRLADSASFRLAVDLPSGVATDDGALLSPVPCFDLTLALGALKPAHRLQPAADRCGIVQVADIGLRFPDDARVTEVAQPELGPPAASDHKYSRGMVVVAAGSMPGAATLAAAGAQRAGAGYVLLAGAAEVGPLALVHRAATDANALARILADARVGAVVVGPGLGADTKGRARLEAALASGHPLVLDADALNLLAVDGLDRLTRLAEPPVLTPHEGEFARLFVDLGGSKIERARIAARRCNAVVLLKGADSVVAHPDGRVAIAPPGSPWLASAGTGDVLAGLVAAMRARGLDPFAAAQAALWLHGEAARRAGAGLIADDLLAHLPAALAACA